jgi:hypothetical protein
MPRINYQEYLKAFLAENNLSQVSRDILDDYFRDIKLSNAKQSTINYNIKVMIFVMQSVKNDLNELTGSDIKLFQER